MSIAILEARIAEIGRSRLMYGAPGWTQERAGMDSLNVKRLLNEIEELNTWRVHKKESVARIANLRKRIDTLTLLIRNVDNHTPKTITGGVRKKRNVSCALRLQRKNLEIELNEVCNSWSAPTDVVSPLIQDELRHASLLENKENSWADEE